MNYYNQLEWVEVPMWKALKVWANNNRHVKCVKGNSTYFYNGHEPLTKINHNQVTEGKWFIEKM